MNLPKFELVQPQSLQDVCKLLQEDRDKAALLAGGTALIVYLRYRLRKPSRVVSLKALPALREISKNGNGELVMGAMVSLKTIETSTLILNHAPVLAEAVRLVAVPPIRQQATLGGNICLDTRCIFYNQSEAFRSSQQECFKLGGKVCHAVKKGLYCQSVCQSDLAPVLIALGAKVKIASAAGERIIPLAGFFTGKGEKPNILGPHEILVEVIVPPLPPFVSLAYEKLRVREGMDFPLAGVAVMVKKNQEGHIEEMKSVLGALGSSPIEVSHEGKRWEGKTLTDHLLQSIAQEAISRAHPVGNLAMDAAYRRRMVGVLLKRAFRRAVSMS